MSAVYNNTGLGYDTVILVFTGSVSGSYVTEDFTINRPTKNIQRYNELSEPSGQVIIADFVNGTATVQIPNSSSNIPVNGITFAGDYGEGVETFIVSQVDRPYAQDTLHKVNITFTKKY